VIDAGHHHAVTGFEQVLAIIEAEFHASVHDHVKVDTVGVVHRDVPVGLELDG
jgi:hypothetical protein